MAREKVLVPDIGDIDAVDVVEVLVSTGDRVAVEDPLITLESEKASMDVPSPLAGVVAEVKVKTGDKVCEGDLILTLDAEEGAPEEEAPAAEPPQETPVTAPAEESAIPPRETAPPEAPADGDRPEVKAAAESPRAAASPAPVDEAAFAKAYASPAVRRFARELGVDLARVSGSGRKGRILKQDVQAFVKKTLAEPPAAAPGFALPKLPVIDFSKFGEIERQPLSRIQKIAGPRLRTAWLTMPHVTQHDEADITELEAFRQARKAEAKEQGFNLTPLAFVMKAAVGALKKYPTVNASLDPEAEQLILKRYYHLGFAVDTPGGLVVPVIRDADCKGLFDIARELAEISAQAREGKLKPGQIQGASYTITSLGGIGGTFFTPIRTPPEGAIRGVSRSYQKPVWGEGAFRPQLTLPISLSYDHRVIDGALAVRFTSYLCELLADIRRLVL
ncbi:MAG: dihydrolipoyllysine-residue acetyltransferase [Thermoanaerobaculia bacterium]